MKKLIPALVLLSALAVPATAEPPHAHREGMTHDGPAHDGMAHDKAAPTHGHGGTAEHDATAHGGATPQEPGQGAFAAIAEIVAILRADPETDWSRVDLDGLRRHLLDMDDLITGTTVEQTPVGNGVRMRLDTTIAANAAASRMVPAHAPLLGEETGWSSSVAVGDGEIAWTVTGTTPGDIATIRGLGFFGLMATGAHHQTHHLMMARGHMAH